MCPSTSLSAYEHIEHHAGRSIYNTYRLQARGLRFSCRPHTLLGSPFRTVTAGWLPQTRTHVSKALAVQCVPGKPPSGTRTHDHPPACKGLWGKARQLREFGLATLSLTLLHHKWPILPAPDSEEGTSLAAHHWPKSRVCRKTAWSLQNSNPAKPPSQHPFTPADLNRASPGATTLGGDLRVPPPLAALLQHTTRSVKLIRQPWLPPILHY